MAEPERYPFEPSPGSEYYPHRIDRPNGNGTLWLEVSGDGDTMACGFRWLEGSFDLPPKALLRAAREEIHKIEDIAKHSGVSEMRHSGGDRAVFFPDYEAMPELPHGRRKRL
jgi:hypothetical protein